MEKRRKRRRYAALLRDTGQNREGTGGKLHELDHDPLQAALNMNIMITTHHRCKL